MQETNNQMLTFNLYPLKSEEEQANELTNSMFVPISNKSLGIENPDYQLTEKQELQRQLNNNEIKDNETLPIYTGAENQNPSAWDITKDIGKGLVEGVADGLVVGSWAGLVADENTLNIFETQTAAGDFVKTATKYITAGALAFSTGSILGLGTKQVAKWGGKKLIGKGARALLGKRKFYKGSNKLTDTLVNKIFNPRNVIAGAYADYTAYTPEEGHLSDILTANGVDNPIVNYLSADVNDTIAEAKIKNVVEGLILTPFIGVATDVLIPRMMNSFKNLKQGTQTGNIEQIVKASKEINTTISQNDLVNNVQEAIRRGNEENRDPQEIIREMVTDDKLSDADYLFKTLENGETIIPNPDGTFSIKINNWEEGYKVTQEEFNRQLMDGFVTYSTDEFKNINLPHNISRSKPRYNAQTINFESDVDKTLYIVRNRNTKSKAHDEFMSYLKEVFPQKTEEEIRSLGDKIFADFKSVAKNTIDDEIYFPKTFEKYLDKINPVSKSVVEMEKAYSQILQERGLQQLDNEPNEKYFNRLAKYYSDKWKLPNDKKISVEIVNNIKGNKDGVTRYNSKNGTIDIKINANSRNKLAVLRAELEHARDYATENFKDKSPDRHFYRYRGKNETEWAKEYVHKKSVSRALRNGLDIPENVLKAFNEKNIDKPSSLYWKETENNLFRNLTLQEKATQSRLFNLLAQAGKVTPKELKRLFTAAANGSKSADAKLEQILETVRAGDFFTTQNTFAENTDLFIDQLGLSPQIQIGEVGHDEEMANLILDRLYNKNFTNNLQSVNEAEYAKELERQKIINSVQEDFYNNFYKELQNSADNAENLEKLKNDSITKINAYETLDEASKAEMLKEVEENINSFKEHLQENIKITETIEETEQLAKDIEKSETQENALNNIDEALTKENAFRSPEVTEKVVQSYIKKIKTRTFEEASEKAQECEKFISAHISDENFSGDELVKIIKNDLGKSEIVSDRILAFTEILGKIKSLSDDLNKRLAINPNDVETLEKISNLTDSYSYIDKAILQERSHAGRALNEIKLFNKAYRFYTRGEGFERNLTEAQKETLEATTDLFSRTFKEIYEEFFTEGELPPSLHEVVEHFIKRLTSKNKNFDAKTLNRERLNSFVSHILKSIEGVTPEEQWRLIKKYFRIYNKFDYLANYVQGASLTQNITGLHAFKKNFGSNLAHYYVGNILSSPATQIANTLSGVVNMAFENTAKIIGGIKTGDKQLITEASDTISGYLKYWSESLQFAMQVFKSEQGIIADTRKYGIEISPYAPLEAEKITPLSAKSFGLQEGNLLYSVFDILGGVLRSSGRIMGATDEFLSQLNYRGLAWADALKNARQELGSGSSSLEIEPLAEQYFKEPDRYFSARNEATNVNLLYETRKLIYQNNLNRKILDPITGEEIKMEETSWVSNFGNLFEQARLRVPVLKFVMPFVRTPYNILEQIVDYTPAAQFTKKYKQLTGQKKSIADAKMLIGGAMITLSSMLAFSGKVTGSPPTDDKARKILMQSGWQPYSFVVTNPDGTKQYLSYKRLEPIASIAGLGADIANLVNIGVMSDTDIGLVTQKLAFALLQNSLDKSYLNQGLDMLDLLTISNDADVKKMQRVINNFAGGFYPLSSGVNWFKNGEYIRDTRAYVDTIAQRSMFRSNDGVMPSRNYFGEIRPLSNKMVNTVTRITQQQNDAADKELLRLSSYGATISAPKRMLGNDNEIDMTSYRNSDGQTAYDAVLQNMSEITINGMTLRQAVNNLVNSQYYNDLPDGVSEDDDHFYKSKKKAINILIQKYAKKAQREVLNSGEYINENGIDLDTSYSNWKHSRKYVTLSDELKEAF